MQEFIQQTQNTGQAERWEIPQLPEGKTISATLYLLFPHLPNGDSFFSSCLCIVCLSNWTRWCHLSQNCQMFCFHKLTARRCFFFYFLFIIDPEQARHCTTATSGGPAWQISVDILLLLHSDCVFLCRHGNTGPRRLPHQQELPQRKFGVYICSSAFRHTSCHLLVRDMVAQLEK